MGSVIRAVAWFLCTTWLLVTSCFWCPLRLGRDGPFFTMRRLRVGWRTLFTWWWPRVTRLCGPCVARLGRPRIARLGWPRVARLGRPRITRLWRPRVTRLGCSHRTIVSGSVVPLRLLAGSVCTAETHRPLGLTLPGLHSR